ncbi:MAG: ankyrin repeat domain-containing protein [Acidobacteria bacterium]|nr:ankyrin repeat domain-containing protein [Acidobacteriota bacterium]
MMDERTDARGRPTAGREPATGGVALFGVALSGVAVRRDATRTARALGLLVAAWLVLPGTAAASDSPLADAAMEGDAGRVRLLLERGASLRAAQGDGMTALHWAAFRDDLRVADLLLAADADVMARTRVGGLTPLWFAAENGSAAMLDRLLTTEADVNVTTSTGATLLMAAALSGSVEAIDLLVARGAFLDTRDTANGQTALMFAAWENRADAIRALAGHGAHVGLMSLIVSMIEPRLDREGNPIPPRRRRAPGGNSVMGGMTALLFAARDGHMGAVRALFESGADVDQVSGGDGTSPIVIAIANGHYTVAQYLLDRGADPNLVNIDGLGPVYATVNMRFAPVSWAPNPRTDQEAVDSLDLLRALLARGADPDARIARKLWFSPTSHDRSWVDPSGSTPFWRASQSSDVEAMRILVDAGADPNLATARGTTPLMVAAGIGWAGNFTQNAPDSFLDAVRYCLELGADVRAVDARGFTALHGAAGRGDNEMVRYLVERGARVDAINRDGNSPADMAFGPSRFFLPKPDTVDLLVALGSPFQDNCRSDQCVDGKFFGGADGAAPFRE